MSNVPIKYESRTYMWVMVPWSIEPHKESPYFMTSVGHRSGGLFNVFQFGDSEVATDGRMDGRCHKLFCDPHPP